MSFLLFALLTCGAAASGIFAGSLLRRTAARNASLDRGDRSTLTLAAGTTDRQADDPVPTFALGLGDVLSRGNAEAVLGGAYVLREEGVDLAAVFTSLGPRGGPLVMAFAPPSDEIFWLQTIEDDAALAGPQVLELGGAIVELTRRLPIVLASVGEGTTLEGGFTGEATLFEYRGDAGRCAIVLALGTSRQSEQPGGARRGLVAHGTICALATLDRLPGPFRAE